MNFHQSPNSLGNGTYNNNLNEDLLKQLTGQLTIKDEQIKKLLELLKK
jgi:hypothetical protein